MKRFIYLLAFILTCQLVDAQTIHSHNDYRQRVPFWEAYIHGARSIEADLYLRNGSEIVVCHDPNEVAKAPLFEDKYLSPLAQADLDGKGMILMLDLKASANEIISPLLELLKKHAQEFGQKEVKVVISGNRPAKESWNKFPDYIYFDGSPSETYTQQELSKVGLISDDMKSYTSWNGKGMIPPMELEKIKNTISNAHLQGKPFRFWNTSDNPNTWLILTKLGVDFINTDNLSACSAFFGTYKANSYTLNKAQPTYKPTYKSDGRDGNPKNIIFIIGDGMSINQITAAEIANRGALTLLNILNIGFIKTWALNSGVTDSAGAGTAMATGQKTNNRHIATSPDGQNIPNAAEVLGVNGRRIGVITSGDITDATPAAQYAHSIDRENSEEIAAWLTKGKVDFMAGSNHSPFVNRKDGRNLFKELKDMGYTIVSTSDSVHVADRRIACIDEKMGDWTSENDINSLAKVVSDAIKNLNNSKGFYMMVESAKIDHGGHANNLRNVILETLKLDALLSEALQFADRDGNTLVIVTGDHETGGLTLLGCDRQQGTVNVNFSTNDHTGVEIPVFAYGVGSQHFRGVYENTEIFKKIMKLLSN